MAGDQNFLKIKEEPMVTMNEAGNGGRGGGGGGDGGCSLESFMAGLRDGGPPPFLKKTFEMVDDPETDSIISWSDSEKSFILWDLYKFSAHLLPQRFKHSNFSSFVRQLNTYRFKKIDSDRWEFANESFQKGKKHLLREIKRKTTNQTQNMRKQAEAKQQQQQQPCVHQTIESELDILRKDRIGLRQEILNMKQQQEKTEKQLEIVQERILRMEFKLQKQLEFMSKAYRSPAFVKRSQQFMQKQNTGNVETCKKRKFEKMLSMINADELKHTKQVWNMMEPDSANAFSSDESVSPLEDQKTRAISGLNSPDYGSDCLIMLKKLMKNEVMIHSGEQSRKDQTKTYLQEWEELIPKV